MEWNGRKNWLQVRASFLFYTDAHSIHRTGLLAYENGLGVGALTRIDEAV